MKHKHQKTIAILLTVAMLFSIMPVNALAATMDSTVPQTQSDGLQMQAESDSTSGSFIDATTTTAGELQVALTKELEKCTTTGAINITVTLKPDAPAEMITAIRRAICDTDGSIHLTLKGVTTIPGTTNWDGVAFGPRNAQWDENDVEIVSHEEVTQLASVNLPDVTEIGAQAFYFCENLVSVSAPKAQTIGAQALGYTALTSVEFPELTTIPTDMFSGTWTLSSAKFPKVTTIEQGGLLVGAKFKPENNPTPFPLELTAEGDITFSGSNHFNIAEQNYSGKVDLVLCCDKKDAVTFHDDGTATWQVRNDLSYTFKSITFKHSYVDGKCTACGEDCAHTGGTATCTTLAVCDTCGVSYGEVDTTNHDSSVECVNGFCENGCYEPAALNAEGYYEIDNAGKLFWFAQQVNVKGNREIKGVLTAHIDLENKPWTPIGETGEENNNFRGVFDGQNYTIRGLNVEGSENGVGFFGEVRTGTVKNFTIYGNVVVNTEVDYVGGVIGSICGVNGETDLERNGAIIQNITSFVNVTAKANGAGTIGGFVGYADHQSLIEQCSWYGTFDAGEYRVDSGAGGFIGKIQENTSEVTIRNCGAYGTIKTNYAKNSYNNNPTIYMGGFLSFSNTNAQTTLENCLFAGRFERGENLTDEARLGAFGTLRSVNAIKNCYYRGDDGLAAVHSDSLLKPGSDNVEITKVTGEELRNNTIATQLGDLWEQDVHYPIPKDTKSHSVIVIYTDNGDGTHKKVCSKCGYVAASENHTLTYTTNGSTITESCSANCGYSASLTLKAPANLVYDRTEKAATVEGEIIADYELTYSADAVIMAGDYTATLTVGDYSVSLAFTIAKADPDVVTPSDLKATYGQTLADVELPGGWAWKNSSASVGSVGSNTFAAIYTPANISNFNTLERDLTVVVAKAMPTVTAPVAADDLVYNGTEQALITAGAATGGTMQYSLDGSNWSETIPTGKDAKTYTVYYKVVGDSNHNDSVEGSVNVSIAKADAPIVSISTQEHFYTIPTTGNRIDIKSLLPNLCAIKTEQSGVTGTTGDFITNAVLVNGILTYDTVAASAPASGTIIVKIVMQHYADVTVTVNVELVDKQAATITLPAAANGAYNGNAHTGYTGSASAEGFDGAFNITYEGRNGTTYGPSADAPKYAGDYTVIFAIPDSHTTLKGSESLEFTIAKKELTPIVSGSVSKVYDGTTDVPDGHSLSIMLDGIILGDDISATAAAYAYEGVNVGDTKIIASNITLGGADAGNYVLKATTASADVGIITKAVPAYIVPTGLTAANGQVLSAIALPTGWTWADDTLTVGISGGTYQAVFTPADAVNYQTVTDIAITVGHGHSYEAVWSNDETNHWHECACGDKKDAAVHTDVDNDHKCDVCAYVMSTCADADSNHNCDVCGAVLSECVDTTPEDYKCDICGKDLPRPSYGGGGYIPTAPSVSDKVEITVPDTLGDEVNVEAETITTATMNDVKDMVSDDNNLALIGGKDSAVQITAKEDNKPLERFDKPVSVSVPVSKADIKNVKDTGNLTLALVTEDETGNTKLTYVGGSYDAENGTFTAYTNMPGNYVLVEKDDLMKIELTIDSTIAHVNDKSVEKDVPSRIVGSRTLVPAAFVLHHMGCGVEWIGDTRTVVVTLPNGEKLFMPVDTPIPGFGTQPIIENGRTLVPVAYVADMMDAYVLWVGDERKVIIVK